MTSAEELSGSSPDWHSILVAITRIGRFPSKWFCPTHTDTASVSSSTWLIGCVVAQPGPSILHREVVVGHIVPRLHRQLIGITGNARCRLLSHSSGSAQGNF